MAATPSGAGYWIVAADGRVVPFGDARRYGDAFPIPLSHHEGGGRVIAVA